MSASIESRKESLFYELKGRGFNPKPLDNKDREHRDPRNAETIRFAWNKKEGDEAKYAWMTIEDKELVLYSDDRFTKSDNFEKFVKFFKKWAQTRMLQWKVDNPDQKSYDLKMREKMNEHKKINLGEGYHIINRQKSYNNTIPQVKIIIHHSRQLEENEQRFRSVDKIYLENVSGERFLLPTKKPGLAKVFARHIAEGGKINDDRYNHLVNLVEEYGKMAGFVRATRKGQFNEGALKLVNEGLKHYNNLKISLHGLMTNRGYNKYFESYTPVLNEESVDSSQINELFVQETLDPRIANVMPILSKLSKNINENNLVNELDDWAKSLTNKVLEASVGKNDPIVHHKYEVVKNGRRVGTWDGTKFVPYDRSEYKFKDSDSIPAGSTVDRAAGPVGSKEEGLSKIGLEETMYGVKNLFDSEATMDERIEAATQIKNEDDFLKAIVDPSPVVRLYAVQNPNLPLNCLSMAIRDTDATVKAEALKKFEKIKKKGRLSMSEELEVKGKGFKAFRRKPNPKRQIYSEIYDVFYGGTKIGSVKQNKDSDPPMFPPMFEAWYEGPGGPKAQTGLKSVDDAVQVIIDEYKRNTENKLDKTNEDLDSNQIEAGQLGPTEKVGPKGAVGKLVGANESKDFDLEYIKRMLK
jgi:hypothetical protein